MITQKNTLGFTLTELMAVVVIVAILAGIGLGSYKKSIERSHFTEGLVAGTTILESMERFYYDNPDLPESDRLTPDLDELDVELSNTGTCTMSNVPGHCVKTKYFEIMIYNWGVQVYRVQNRTRKDYYFKLYSKVGPNAGNKDACLTSSLVGGDLCKGMGYTSCTGTGRALTCVKP